MGQCVDLVSTSNFLGFAPQHIFYLVENADNYYINIQIPKRSNPRILRDLHIPNSELKGVQRSINNKILTKMPVGQNVHSYVAGRSVLTAAREFCPGKAVLKLDIRDFFPSISTRRVHGFLNSVGFKSKCCFILSKLTTMNDRLAQGAPTSPMLSNLLVGRLDEQLSSLAASWDIKYLRYSDDLFFYKDKNFNYPRLSEIVSNIVNNAGFEINVEKTKYHPIRRPRLTLGLLTHGDKPKIPGPQRRKYRSLFFKASRDVHWAEQKIDLLRGTLEWYKCVYGRNDTYNQYRTILENVSRLKIHDSYRSK